jgi:TPR repeat protein
MYNHGEGVEQDLVEAARLFKLAAEGGYAMAQFNL